MPKGIDELLAAGGQPMVLNGLRYVSWLKSQLDGPQGKPSGRQLAPVAEPFPLGVFPAPLAGFIEQVAASTSTPPDYAAGTLLAVAGAAVGNSRGIELIKNVWYEFGRFYLACVSHPGTGKSPAMRIVWRPLFAFEKIREQQYKKAVRAYRLAKKRLATLE